MKPRLEVAHLMPPLLAVGALAFLALAPGRAAFGESAGAVVAALPFLLAALLALLALRLNQTVLFLVAAALLAVDVFAGAAGPPLWAEAGVGVQAGTLAVAVPVWLIAFYVPGERPLWRASGLLRLVLVPALPPLLLILRRIPAVAAVLEAEAALGAWSVPLAAIFLLGTFYAAVVLSRGHAGFLEFSLLWALAPLLWLLGRPDVIRSAWPAVPLATVSALLILMFALYRLYWQRVYMDELTGVPNRRALNEKLVRLGRAYALAMVDVDHFKAFNDTFGHAEGDNVLRYVAVHLCEHSGGAVFRYGGEEFAVVYVRSDMDEAEELLEETRSRLAAHEFRIRSPQREGRRRRGRVGRPRSVQITISAGLAEPGRHAKSPASVLSRADHALYRAKEGGRNRVVRAAGAKS